MWHKLDTKLAENENKFFIAGPFKSQLIDYLEGT